MPQCEKHKEINSDPLLLRFGKLTFIVYYNNSKEYKHVHLFEICLFVCVCVCMGFCVAHVCLVPVEASGHWIQ